jgi:Hemerythrin HHE cation binding domain
MSSSPAFAAAGKAARTQRALRALIGQVKAGFVRHSARKGCGPDEVAASLDVLRGPLQAHFDEEERAGLFESIEERDPERSADCALLLQEHRSLLSRMDALRAVLPEERRRRSWGGDVQLLLADLLTHEDREAELLRALDAGPAAAG